METRLRKIKSKQFPNVTINVIPGHFATNHSHINYYVDLTLPKSSLKMAKSAGEALASKYAMTTPVDAIVCLDGAEVIATFLAEALSENAALSMNSGTDISIVTPETNSSGQLILRDNTQHMIWAKNVLLLVASVSTGQTLNQAIDYINYYNGRVSGVCAIFSVIEKTENTQVYSIFSVNDLPGYETHDAGACPDCAAGRKIDALVNNFGYSKL